MQVKPGFHINSNKPNDEYLIPLRLTWNAPPFEVVETRFPKPSQESYPFSTKPLSVYSGELAVETVLKVPANAPAGSSNLTGKLRYQACNDKMCLPPKTVDVQIPLKVQ